MKIIKIFVAALAVIGLQFATASAETPSATALLSFSKTSAVQKQTKHKPIRHRHRRVHRHKH